MKMIEMLGDYENGTLDVSKVPELFQNLVDSGLIFELQGSYLRAVKELVEAGLVTLNTADIEE